MRKSDKSKVKRPREKTKPLHEWSVVAYHQINVGKEARKAQTREGKIKSYEVARLWALNFIRSTEMVFLVEVCHVETGEDVPVHRFVNSMGVWKQTIRQRPWFSGSYN